MSKIWDRKCTITFEKFSVKEDFRIQFEIDKFINSQITANECKIEIWNLPESRRNSIKELEGVKIQAGQTDRFYELFSGRIVRVYHQRQIPNVVTVIEAVDGLTTINDVGVSYTFATGCSVKEALTKLLKECKKEDGTSAEIESYLNNVADKKIADGWSVCGSAVNEIERLCTHLGINFFIDAGVLVVLPKGETRKKKLSTQIISSGTGMIGTPAAVKNAEKGNPTELKQYGFEIQSILRSDISVGDGLFCKSIYEKGLDGKLILKVESLKHKGDTKGNEWETLFRCIDPAQVKQLPGT